MKKILLLLASAITCGAATAQITITAADMPVSGDTLRYSIAANIASGINLADSGTARSWNYSSLTPLSQAVDTYKTATAVSVNYFLISINAYGYKVADSFPGGTFLPVSVTQLYTFYEKQSSNSRFAAVAVGAKVAGIATPFNNTKDDILYYFPLNYGNNDSSAYALTIGLTGTASIKQTGYRKTRVDGWGTITTPYYTTPVNCIRVRSEIRGVDSVNFGGFPIGIPRNVVEYKWLVNGEHYPALWVTTNATATGETISSIRYRDSKRDFTNSINEVNPAALLKVKATPNPSANGIVTIDVPADWKQYSVEVFDMQGKSVCTTENTGTLNLGHLAKGSYIGRVTCGGQLAYVQIVLQ